MFLPDHPLHFVPILRSYLWGGNRLERQLGKKPTQNGVWAESWELVDHREAESVVADGAFQGKTLRELIQDFSKEIVGYDAPDERFPLLLKYLDCQRVLSVQVHPDDAYGATMAVPDRGKTEAWYVIEAEEGAKLYAGLKAGLTRETLQQAIVDGTTEETLHVLYPKAGDCVFIPAGTVHALGAGLLVAEIQQASDCTFRLFDWNRVDQDGKPRTLHVEQALAVIDFERGPVDFVTPIPHENGWSELVNCDKFTLLQKELPSELEKVETLLPTHGVAILTLPHGAGELQWMDRKTGERQTKHLPRATTLLLPAACPELTLLLQREVKDGPAVALLALLPATASS